MTSYLVLKYLHLIAFVYWLGGDLGTFIASRQVINPALGAQARQTALGIMLACDMGPKLAMPLILPLGLHMAAISGAIPMPGVALALVWAASIYWVVVVLVLYLNEGSPFTARLAQFDLYFRIAVVAALIAWSTSLLMQGSAASWAAAKVIVFALMVSCGIAIRINLRPFVPAFAQMMADGASAQTDTAMKTSVQRCRPWVWCIWGGLFLNAALGLHLIV